MRKINSDIEILRDYINAEDQIIIDVGCGTGEWVRWMASRGMTVIGMDRMDMIEKAKSYSKVKNEKYIIGEGQQLPFQKDFADVITYIASFHHIPARQMMNTLRECYRVLKTKGKAIIIEPVSEKGSYYDIIRLVEDESKIQEQAYQVLRNFHEVNLRFILEERFYLERSFQDYINLLKVFMDSGSDRNTVIEKARKITRQLCQSSGKNLETFRYQSIARFILMEKN